MNYDGKNEIPLSLIKGLIELTWTNIVNCRNITNVHLQNNFNCREKIEVCTPTKSRDFNCRNITNVLLQNNFNYCEKIEVRTSY